MLTFLIKTKVKSCLVTNLMKHKYVITNKHIIISSGHEYNYKNNWTVKVINIIYVLYMQYNNKIY